MSMNKKRTRHKPSKVAEPDLRPEYEFAGAVRGKYSKRYLEVNQRRPLRRAGSKEI